MDTLAAVRLRRQAPLLLALGAGIVFLLVHLFAFLPLVARHDKLKREAIARGIAWDPAMGSEHAALPPRVFSLLMQNSLPPAEADERGQSGALAADMVQILSAAAGEHGLEVIVAEPGLLTQQANLLQARAHLRLRGSYAGFVGFLGELSGDGRLWTLERFSVSPGAGGRCDIEVAIEGCMLKRTRSGS